MTLRWWMVFLLAASPAFAGGTYKWVDAKGVVNYSNAPPPSAQAQPVEERVSVYQTDPLLRRAMEEERRAPAVQAGRARVAVIASRAQYVPAVEPDDYYLPAAYPYRRIGAYPALRIYAAAPAAVRREQ